jgi:hypothetical protein
MPSVAWAGTLAGSAIREGGPQEQIVIEAGEACAQADSAAAGLAVAGLAVVDSMVAVSGADRMVNGSDGMTNIGRMFDLIRRRKVPALFLWLPLTLIVGLASCSKPESSPPKKPTQMTFASPGEAGAAFLNRSFQSSPSV